MPSNLDSHGQNVVGQAVVHPSRPPKPGYETRDANMRGVLGFLVGLLLVILLVFFAVRGLFHYFSATEREAGAAPPFSEVRELPSGPELQVHARVDLTQNQSEQMQTLETYSWEDRKAGTVRIPIERAMDLLIQKGLPVISYSPGQESKPSGSATVEPRRQAGGVIAPVASAAKENR